MGGRGSPQNRGGSLHGKARTSRADLWIEKAKVYHAGKIYQEPSHSPVIRWDGAPTRPYVAAHNGEFSRMTFADVEDVICRVITETLSSKLQSNRKTLPHEDGWRRFDQFEGTWPDITPIDLALRVLDVALNAVQTKVCRKSYLWMKLGDTPLIEHYNALQASRHLSVTVFYLAT